MEFLGWKNGLKLLFGTLTLFTGLSLAKAGGRDTG